MKSSLEKVIPTTQKISAQQRKSNKKFWSCQWIVVRKVRLLLFAMA